jgi:hypothetical protein
VPDVLILEMEGSAKSGQNGSLPAKGEGIQNLMHWVYGDEDFGWSTVAVDDVHSDDPKAVDLNGHCDRGKANNLNS